MEVVFLPEYFKLLFHPNDKLILQFIQLDFKLPSLLGVLVSQVFSLLIGMLQHQMVDSIPLFDF